MTKILLNGREVEADPTKPLIHACHTAGAEVPAYCYHPGLTPVGSCRICQVEVKQGNAPARIVVACRTLVVEGMIVETESPAAREVRRECLEFLLKNHPLDCPICDKAGECDLQDYAFAEGQGEGRSNEPRRRLDKRKSLGDVIVLDEERCVLCSRCVRFMEEVPKTPQLTVGGLGSRSVIETFMDRPLSGNYQGNLADVCPVGALTLKPFRFQARVWNLKKTASTCGECSRGCATTVEVLRAGEVKRVRPRYDADVNTWWMCDTGRFAFPALNVADRIPGGLVRRSDGWVRADAADTAAAAARLLGIERPAFVAVTPWVTQEEGAAILALAREWKLPAYMVSPAPNGLADDLLHTGDPAPNRFGLEQLGFARKSPAEIIAHLHQSSAAWLVGERMTALIGAAALEALPAHKRIALFDVLPIPFAALEVFASVPLYAERSGTWLNVDGIPRALLMARALPAGMPSLERMIGLVAAARAVAVAPGPVAPSSVAKR